MRGSFSEWQTETPWFLCGLATLAFLVAMFGPVTVQATAAEAADSAGQEDVSNRPIEVGEPTGIAFEPERFELRGRRSRQQLLVTGNYGSEEMRDLTSAVEFTSTDPAVVKIVGGVARPVANGTASVIAKIAGFEATAEVVVHDLASPFPVSFKNETLAALSKAGCNSGACHGSPSGKAGFRLSLRAFDPPLDIMTLRTEFFGRRTNPMKPAESLMLQKPTMQLAHGGGRRLREGDPAYRVLHDWIAEGLRIDGADSPDLVRTEIIPAKRVLSQPADRQQLFVLGHFSDGTVRDLTELTVFTSSNESVATASELGLVEKAGRGETAVLARYLDKMVTSHITFLEDVEGFAWSNPEPRNFIDVLAFEKLKQLQILPSELCTDEEFVRRAYLDTTGRLPKIEETMAFLSDESSDKRDQLIDALLDTSDFAAFWTLKWCDVLRSNSKKLKPAGVHKFRRWVYDGVRNDKPINQLARELLTARGSVFENPAANYWRASRDPNDATETTAQLFLGIRIQCAKCHNHPFERWSQDNYYGIAAAFNRIGHKKSSLAEDDEIVFVKSSGEMTQPRTGETMKVHLLLQGDVDVPPGQDRRRVFAEWLTSPGNPFFARSAVNRVWGHLMGRGIVEPVDDFRDSNPPSNEKLLDELAGQFAENNFSQKWAIRTIMRSRLYQLSSRKNDFNKDDEIYGSHATTRLLSAEQLLDAICQVTDVAEKFEGMPPGTPAVALPEPPKDHYFLKVFGQPQREMACECERSNESNLSQALQMINGPLVHDKLRSEHSRIANDIKAGKPDEEIVSRLYLAAMCRKPVEEELAAATAHIAAAENRQKGLEDVGWAVLNSKEFLFQH
jgi:hypothetical protein